MPVEANAYGIWLVQVGEALNSINMPMETWQPVSEFNFRREFAAGTSPNDAALKANKFWWYQQNRAIGQDCRTTPNCWLPRDHQGECQSR
jgi:hypothetical protein